MNQEAKSRRSERAATLGGARDAAEVLWYPLGVFLAVLAAVNVLLFSCSGRWIG